MACAESDRVHALVDGELVVAEAAALAQHLAGCAECEALAAELQALRASLKAGASRYAAGPALRGRIARALAADGAAAAAKSRGRRDALLRQPAFWSGAAGGALAAGVAALAIVASLGRGVPDALEHDVLSAHLRAQVSGHPIDVESSDRHTVKPWLAGHADVAPPVTDFAADGFVLSGGRVDYVDGTRAAVVVYRHGAHLIDVFAWRDAAGALRERAVSANGYRLLFWRAGDLAFCAVSDTADAQLVALKRLITATLPADTRE